MSITEQYIFNHNKYKKIHGEKTLVLMQVGSFYEMYATETEGPNLKEIADLINTVCTKKDKNIKEVSIKNPYLVGFPMVAVDKFVSILINNGFTLVMIDQVTPPPDPQRKVTNIYSPSTYIGTTLSVTTNYAACLYFEYEQQINKPISTSQVKNNILCAGLAAIDISTGHVVINESISTHIDLNIAMDDTQRFLSTIQPKEIFLVLNGTGKFSEKDFIDNLQLDERIVKIKKYDSKYSKIKFQQEFLSLVYDDKKSLISIIEQLDLEKTHYARTSLILLIDFIKNYSDKLIKNINNPETINNNDKMILGNNATYQLSIIENDNYNYYSGIKYKSLYDVVNNAKTPMGKRFIKNILTAPLISDKKIQKYLNLTETLIEKKLFESYADLLSNICDIEKLSRKMSMQNIHPYELAEFIESFKFMEKIIEKTQNNKLEDIVPTESAILYLKKFNIELTKIFNLDELKKNILTQINSNLFNRGIYPEIDKLSDSYHSEHNFITQIKDTFEKILVDLSKSKKNLKSESLMKIDSTPKEGYFISMSAQRFELISKHYEKTKDEISINNIKFKFEDLIIKSLKSTVKIFFDKIKKNNNQSLPINDEEKKGKKIKKEKKTEKSETDISDIEADMLKLIYKSYIELIKKIFDENINIIKTVTQFITTLDYTTSNAITAKKYNYVKPELNMKSLENFIHSNQLRHPIVERIIDYEYVPHDIKLDSDLNGMLIYGLNSSGKSVMMKAVGLNLIMAQCGMYVSATKFKFKPYTAIYTRITGNDNIFKGQSSFTLEMTELNSIIKRANNSSLIIGDEVCRGTENISGNSIVAATIAHLAKCKATFIFATHLHELVQLNIIKSLVNVKAFHLAVDYDSNKDVLIYDRTLKEGSGDKVYGILVAKCIIDNKEFIEETLKIKNELTQNLGTLISGKKSRYNADILVYKCEVCGKEDKTSEMSFLQTHHINHQKDCVDGFSVDKPHIPMNSAANLTVICESCHNKVHSNEITINKKIMTSKGKKLKS
jgi:DNA mismatch repair protein MutS